MKDQSKKQVARVMDYRNVFNSESGKRVLYDIMKNCHMTSAIPPVDPIKMAFAEGERNVALRIMTQLKMDPKKLEQMIENGESND